MFTSSSWLIDKTRRSQLYSGGGRWVGGTLTTKVRYRGLMKNTLQLTTLFALSNLWMVRHQLLAERG